MLAFVGWCLVVWLAMGAYVLMHHTWRSWLPWALGAVAIAILTR